jgi:hypothetical protein
MDRLVHGDELGAVGEGRLDLHLRDHLRHSLHHIAPLQNGASIAHEVGDAAPIARALQQLRRDNGHRLRMVQTQPARLPLARQLGRHEDEQLLLLARCQVH